jgi:protein-disulfide isomerase
MNNLTDNIKKFSSIGLMVVLFSAASFYVGTLYTKVQFYEKGDAPVAANVKGDTAANPAPTPAAAKTDVDKPTSKDHTRGSKDAQIALIEYSDYSCPFCKQFHTTMTQVMTQYNGKVKWIHRNFPLTQLHPNAYKQAIAAECVAKLSGEDKFWQFLDKLYTAEPSPDVAGLKTMAAALGVDATKFNTCLDNDETKAVVDADKTSASKAGVTGTPGNFLYNLKTGDIIPLRGAVPFDSLKVSIDSML